MKLAFCYLVLFFVSCFGIEKISIPADLGASSPGLKTSITQPGLNYVAQVGATILEQQLKTLTVPDQSGSAGTPIGHVDWTLTSIQVTGFQIGGASIELQSGSGLQLSLTGISVSLSANWHYREHGWPHVSDSGSADVSVSSTSASVTLQISTVNYRPYVQVIGDSVSIGGLDIHLHGGASWLYNFFLGLLNGQVKSAIEKAIQNGISQNVNAGANSALSTLPISQTINNDVEINFELLANPTFTSNYLSIAQLGEFYQIANAVECPTQYCTANSLPDVTDNNMVQIALGDFVANSAGYVFWKLDQLKTSIQNSQVPSWAPVQLNTTFWKYLLPAIYEKWPDNLMQVNIYATDSPKIVFSTGGADVRALGNLEMMIIENDGSLSSAFTLGGWVATEGQAILSGQKIFGNLTYLKSNFSLSNSNVGPFNPQVLLMLINLAMENGIVPALNTLLAQGIDLPVVQGVDFVNPTVGWNNGYLSITTAITYNPPELLAIKQKNKNDFLKRHEKPLKAKIPLI